MGWGGMECDGVEWGGMRWNEVEWGRVGGGWRWDGDGRGVLGWHGMPACCSTQRACQAPYSVYHPTPEKIGLAMTLLASA